MALGLWSGSVPLQAQTLSELQQLEQQLGDEPPAVRQEAFEGLSRLGPEALPTVAAYLEQRLVHPIDQARAEALLLAFRQAVGGRRADTAADIAPGALVTLKNQRDADARHAAASLALLRALERMPGTAVASAGVSSKSSTPRPADLADTLALLAMLDEGAWIEELQRAAARKQDAWLPAWIALRGDTRPAVRRAAASMLEALGSATPAQVTQRVHQNKDAHLLAQLLLAYARSLDFSAMPVVVSFTGDEHIQVRQAAREATARFGRNAIWQLRERYEDITGQKSDRSWDWQRMAQALYTVLDRQRIETSETWLAEGLEALRRGDLTVMAERYDAILLRDPTFERAAQLAPGYATLGASYLAADALDHADAAFARACRLAPEHPDAPRWHAERAFITAERALSRGVADLESYHAAIAKHPGHTQARRVLDQLQQDPRDATRTRRWAGFVAVALLVTSGVLILRRPRRNEAEPTPAEPALDTTTPE